jgi:NADPH:quinone reductase-like Zn-dependent oxidoreductase
MLMVRSAAGFAGSSRFFTGLRGLKRRILGTEYAVQVAEVDDGVTGVRRRRPRLRRVHLGGHAEYVCVLARHTARRSAPSTDTQKTDPATCSRRLTNS